MHLCSGCEPHASKPRPQQIQQLPLIGSCCVCCVVVVLQVVICVLHAQRSFVDEGWFSVMVATQQVLLWMKLVRH